MSKQNPKDQASRTGRSSARKAINASLTPPEEDVRKRGRDYPQAPRDREQIRTGSPAGVKLPRSAGSAAAQASSLRRAGKHETLDEADTKTPRAGRRGVETGGRRVPSASTRRGQGSAGP